MKRKPSTELICTTPAKRQPHDIPAITRSTNLLVGILQQYGLLEIIVSNLCAEDLLALALTSKVLHEAIAPRPCSLENLLGRLCCSGKGVETRKNRHKKSGFMKDLGCTEYVKCGTQNKRRDIETKPCVSCKVATCNECRTHCVYQTIYESPSEPSDPDELPNFSGYVLLRPFEHPILSPHHLTSDDTDKLPRWQDPSTGAGGPYHDQGYVDIPFSFDTPGAPECVADILDMDLGQYSMVTMARESRYIPPSPVLCSFMQDPDARKVLLCGACFENDAPKGPSGLQHTEKPMPRLPWLSVTTSAKKIKTCCCTMRKRFLDRWLCLRCYQAEQEIIYACRWIVPVDLKGLCRCGERPLHTMCLWCWGEIKDDADTRFPPSSNN